jgi:SAM-dependent methyltransferase
MDDHTSANRANWDAWTAINAASANYDVAGFKAGKLSLNRIEREELGDVAGKSLLHLQCHFGLDTLSWARLGARVTGVDFSPEAIKLAHSLADEIGLDARFVCSDLYELPGALDDRFDIVYTSYGVLFWLKDLARWAEIVAQFLRPGGTFYIVELHPFINVFDNEDDVTGFRVRWPYFHSAGPVEAETHGTYSDPQADYHSVEYSWGFGLGEVINAVLGAGLRLEWLHEFPFCPSKRFPFMEQGEDGLWRWQDPANTMPLLFSLKATKVAR